MSFPIEDYVASLKEQVLDNYNAINMPLFKYKYEITENDVRNSQTDAEYYVNYFSFAFIIQK
jgi:hypothetical protein